MGDFNTTGDNLVIFRAIPNLPARPPLGNNPAIVNVAATPRRELPEEVRSEFGRLQRGLFEDSFEVPETPVKQEPAPYFEPTSSTPVKQPEPIASPPVSPPATLASPSPSRSPSGSPIRRASGRRPPPQETSPTAAPPFPETPAPVRSPSVPHHESPAPIPEPESEPAPEVPKNVQLQDLFHDVDIDTMERGIQKGIRLLDRLTHTLSSTQPPSPEAKAWLSRVQDVRKFSERVPTVVGVVGNTGAGKSSVINALLDEERLLPTNCMRACTAVVTEISYNHETDEKYRAQIEFISEAEWFKELESLFQDVASDTEANISWEKIKAVYPKMTKDDITHSSADHLLEKSTFRSILGSSKVINATDSMVFYKQLQKYVDSREKTQRRKKGEEKRPPPPPREMEYWPLIRVVKIQVKSPVLETGAVVVDLPGVHDANQARAAVADGYIKKCTGLWVVAPINRAVDDKSAQKLLGEGFRRQLLMDGGYNSLTFICSKSDDISVSEAMLSLNMDDELAVENEDLENLERSLYEKKEAVKQTKEEFDSVRAELEIFDDQLAEWEELREKAASDEVVYMPKPKPQNSDRNNRVSEERKRKRGNSLTQRSASKKKKSYAEDSDDDFIVGDDEVEDDDGDSDDDVIEIEDESDKEDEDRGEPLTTEQIDEKVKGYRASKLSGYKKKRQLSTKIDELKKAVREIQEKIRDIERRMAIACIKARNEYSTSAIQQHFATGLQELDREAGEEQDGENFDPSIPMRDYDAVARSLPVFCVSSRGYQKVSGRLKRDGDPTVFKNALQTEMPGLQAHCAKMTEKGRLASGRRFLTNVSQLCNSLSMWSSDADVALSMSVEQKARERRELERHFKELDGQMQNAVDTTTQGTRQELTISLYDRYGTATAV